MILYNRHLLDQILYPQDIHMDIRTNKSSAVVGLPDVLMATLSNDTITETPRPGTTFKNGRFQLWERELLESSEVRRKSTVAQLCTCYTAKI
jgi:cell cycle protein kinase DBF2